MKYIIYLCALFLSAAVFAAEQMPATDTMNEEQAAPTTTEQSMPETAPAAEATETTTEASTTESATAAPEQAGFSRGSVVRSIFTTAVQDREPVDKLANSASDAENVFYFTELRDMSGQTAVHRWEHDGKVMAEIKFDVRGPRWRVWSSKSFVPQLAGDWKVSVVNGAGETISEEMISLSSIPSANAAAADAEAAPAEATPASEPESELPATQPIEPMSNVE